MVLDPASGHRLLFIEVPEEKAGKNRIHLDLVPRAGTRDEELVRLLTLVVVVATAGLAALGRLVDPPPLHRPAEQFSRSVR